MYEHAGITLTPEMLVVLLDSLHSLWSLVLEDVWLSIPSYESTAHVSCSTCMTELSGAYVHVLQQCQANSG